MKLAYICKADPPPPMSDFVDVLAFFDSLPEHLHPTKEKNASKRRIYFADRVGSKWIPEFHDFAIAFISGRFLNDEKAMECLERASKSFPNMVCIDLYDNLTAEQKEKIKMYTINLYSLEEGKNFLINTFPDEDIISKQEAEALEKSIETDGYKFLEDTIEKLKASASSNKLMSCLCYFGALAALIGMGCYIILGSGILSIEGTLDLYTLIYESIEIAVLSGVLFAITRFLFLLGKSYMVEAIRFEDRAHAIGLGKLYLQLYKSKFDWNELKDVLQNWNIDKGSAFINLDAKDIETVGVDKIVSSLGK